MSDNCVHVVLQCCTHVLRHYRLGEAEVLTARRPRVKRCLSLKPPLIELPQHLCRSSSQYALLISTGAYNRTCGGAVRPSYEGWWWLAPPCIGHMLLAFF